MLIRSDYLVLGGGIAGLTFALEAAEKGEVVVATKAKLGESATAHAQGGIAAVLDPADSFAAHESDTHEAGRGLSHADVVAMVVREAPERIRDLIKLGASFSRGDGTGPDGLDLTQEGGHTARRVVHAGDVTGREVQRALCEAARNHPRIRILEDHMAIDLIDRSRFGGARFVTGAYVLERATGAVHTLVAGATVLATGGAGKVYLYTTNPDVATGDGVAMAYRAGAEIGNMEFFQFHPTCLFHPHAKSFLISEALRGEGGILRRRDGSAFMASHHPQADLAPRDVVARAIDYELKRTGEDCVWLDMSARSPEYLRERFPNIHAECLKFGIDLTREPIPVVPAAHYMCGGVVVDADGRTSVPGLWAIGETACTGLHGANRLASNSLLEGLVYGRRAAIAVQSERRAAPIEDPPPWDAGSAVASDEAVIVAHNWDELRRFMWNYVGIVRSEKRLERAARRIALLADEIREYYWTHLVTADLLELRNIADVAHLIVACARFRKESRGLHYNLDHERLDDAAFHGDTILSRGTDPRLSRI
ncbi:MAG TPA: L-aspartate oxidase [Polyangiales bacterium]|jgi:L-aspartate oxidase|nr:L-aspartate oxidase [Polyangiales bacterium]